jgi:hypothetical protein
MNDPFLIFDDIAFKAVNSHLLLLQLYPTNNSEGNSNAYFLTNDWATASLEWKSSINMSTKEKSSKNIYLYSV